MLGAFEGLGRIAAIVEGEVWDGLECAPDRLAERPSVVTVYATLSTVFPAIETWEVDVRGDLLLTASMTAATYDAEGNYIYPEGFDPETGEWLEGFEKQREVWEKQYADARERWEAHTKQVQASREADADAALNPAPVGVGAPAASSTSSTTSSSSPAPARAAEEPSGTLATDEALAALREKLAGGKS